MALHTILKGPVHLFVILLAFPGTRQKGQVPDQVSNLILGHSFVGCRVPLDSPVLLLLDCIKYCVVAVQDGLHVGWN